MSEFALRVYHRLPAPLRSLAASLRGHRLRQWRYGPETDELIGAALERDQWTRQQWDEWQRDRLTHLLHNAATRVPYYRDYWRARRLAGDRVSWEYLENWPILAKDQLRTDPAAFLSERADPRRMRGVNTSGTTGKPLQLWRSRATERAWYAILEARLRRWNHVDRGEQWAVLGGQVVIPARQRRPPYWVHNAPLKQLYLSANHVSEANAPAYLTALRRYRVTHLIAYTSSATVLAAALRDSGLCAPPDLRIVITNAEPLHQWQREILMDGFGTEVRETYGMVEAVAGASECTAGTMHCWPDVGIVEVFEDDADVPVKQGASGRFVCTGLLNDDMPLIRYDLGDRGSISAETVACSCGRRLPAMGPIEGRSNDLLLAPDGRKVFWLNPVFYGLPIREAQIVQNSLFTVQVKYVAAEGFNSESRRLVRERLTARLGDVRVEFCPVSRIPRLPNGKFQAVVCNVASSEAASTV